MDWSGAPDSVDAGRLRDDSNESREELQRAVFPRYQVADEIGRGGMAFVFRGWDTTEHRAVAFKVLKQHLLNHLASPDALAQKLLASYQQNAPLRVERWG